mmetsp:Transcript_14756/g.27146  ORF Transcript_14756/g.27146 Transcript_14756/m.27146 type:complete len:220 (+) Transcript_14756:1158-1817(+)
MVVRPQRLKHLSTQIRPVATADATSRNSCVVLVLVEDLQDEGEGTEASDSAARGRSAHLRARILRQNAHDLVVRLSEKTEGRFSVNLASLGTLGGVVVGSTHGLTRRRHGGAACFEEHVLCGPRQGEVPHELVECGDDRRAVVMARAGCAACEGCQEKAQALTSPVHIQGEHGLRRVKGDERVEDPQLVNEDDAAPRQGLCNLHLGIGMLLEHESARHE